MTVFDIEYDVLVVGAGVAGAHAAYAAAGQQANVLLLTSSWENVGALAWGPRFQSYEDIADKGRLKGFPARAVERSLIFSEPAGPPAIDLVDSHKYQGLWKYCLESTDGLTIFQDTCEELAQLSGRWLCLTGWGAKLRAKTLVLAIGTFLGGQVASGTQIMSGGRPGEAAAKNLPESIRGLGVGLKQAEAKAAPTVSARSIRWDGVAGQTLADRAGRRNGPIRVEAGGGKAVSLEPINSELDQYYLGGWESGDDGPEAERSMMQAIRGLEEANITRPSFSVSFSEILLPGPAGLFAAGRICGAGSYEQSARQGLAAGRAAAAVSRET